MVYLDNILIYAESKAKCLRNTIEVLERLRQWKLFISLKKCEFFVKQVEFLGFIVGTRGITMDPSQVEAIQTWPVPTCH